MKEVYIERCVLASLNHPSIIKLHCSFKHLRKFYLLLEYCPRGSLQEFQKKVGCFSEEMACHVTAEILQALQYLREKRILHRDLKLGNIVLDRDFHAKLIDFGTCKVLNNPEI